MFSILTRARLGLAVVLIASLAGAVPAPGSAASDKGKEAASVIAVTPGVFVERDGQRAPLELKDPVFTNDTIVTDATGKAQILFRDDTTVAVAPDSTIHISQFAFGGEAKPSFGMRMGQGMTRVVTGRVVEQNREGFHITTPHATVGIRGTILSPRVTAADTTVVVSQIGAGHTVSVFNSQTGQVSEVGRGGMAVVASPAGNVARAATPAEMTQAASVARQSATQTASAPADSSAPSSSPSGESSSVAAATTGTGTEEAPADTAATSSTGDPQTALSAVSPVASPALSMPSPAVSGGNAPVPSPSLDYIAEKVEDAARDLVSDGTGADLVPDLPDRDDMGGQGTTPDGGGHHPGDLSAHYAGNITEARGAGQDWEGTFSFDVNLESGHMSGAGLEMVSEDFKNLVRLQNGSGQAASDRFNIGNFQDAPGGSMVGGHLGVTGLDAHLGGSLTLNGSVAPSTTTVDKVQVFQKTEPTLPLVESGHGAGTLVPSAPTPHE